MSSPPPSLLPSPTPWRWIPTLYLGQGLPYVAVMTLAVVMYKNLGVGNAEIALVTSWLYLPWVIKPLWSPLVDLLGRKRAWIVGLQLLVGAAFAGVALVVPVPAFLQWTLVMFWLLAFASATHDIAADGFYILALDRRRQAAFVGVRSTFYRLSMLGGQGGLVWLAGWWAEHHGGPVAGWQAVFVLLAGLFAAFALWHAWALPRPVEDRPAPREADFVRGFIAVFRSFFARDDIVRVLVFLLVYRLGEAQLLKLVAPFLLDARADGGLGLSTQQLGLAYGTVGVAALTAGGLLGGWAISRAGCTCGWPGRSPRAWWWWPRRWRWSSSATASASPPTWCSCSGWPAGRTARACTRRRTTPSAPASWPWA